MGDIRRTQTPGGQELSLCRGCDDGQWGVGPGAGLDLRIQSEVCYPKGARKQASKMKEILATRADFKN